MPPLHLHPLRPPPKPKTQNPSQLPVVTRTYVTLCVLTTAACALDLVTPFSLYYNARLVFQRGEVWRLATSFLYFGNLSLDFVFHMFFLVKYAKQLEEGSFRNRSLDFAWMLVAGAAAIAAAAPLARGRVQFLGSSLAFMMVYVWSRRHRHVRMSFLGVATFTAPYLPWVLLAFSALLRPSGGGVAVDLLGLAVGHCYYFFEDVYPRLTDGRRPLGTPRVLTALFGGGNRGSSRGSSRGRGGGAVAGGAGAAAVAVPAGGRRVD